MPTLPGSDEAMENANLAATENSSLKHEFQRQPGQQQRKEAVQEEIEKRPRPGPSTSRTSSRSKEAASTWLSFILPTDKHRGNPNDEHAMDALLAENSELQQKIKSLHNTLGKLQHHNSYLKEVCSSSKELQEKFRCELAQERLKSAELETKTAKLRSMLIPANETQLSDGEVLTKFTTLRSHILKLVKTTGLRDFDPNQWYISEQQHRILSPFAEGKVNMRYIDNRLRGVVFSILTKHIFSVRHYPVEAKHEHLGEALRNAESYMFNMLPKDRHDSIIDWRMASMKATAAFGNDPTILARTAYDAIDSFFQPFEISSAKAAQGAELLEKICKDAVDLSMMMRTAKDEYSVGMIGDAIGKPASEFEELAEEEALHPVVSKSEQLDTIAYFITGALVKFPYGNPKDMKVLEKAQAVVYGRPKDKKV